MIDLKLLAEKPELKKAILKKKYKGDLDAVIEMDQKRRTLMYEIENLQAEQNKISKEIATAKDKTTLLEKSKNLKEKLKDLEPALNELSEKLNAEVLLIPNPPLDEVPVGKDESENVIIKKWKEPTKFDFEPLDHVTLGEKLDIIDIPRAAKVSGTRFGYWKGLAAQLEFALIQFVQQTLTSKDIIKKIADSVEPGYNAKTFIPVIPPVIIRPEVYTRTGRLSPNDKDEKYHLAQDDMYLIGSAEHTLVSMHMDETLPEEKLPVRYLGFSTCFRREAGSYGKDTKGMIRIHQFDKLEMESFSLSENSLKEHYFFIAIQEYLTQSLELAYQTVLNCTGDMGDPNARQMDIETWLPGQNRYRETHSADYMTDFQARRLNIKVKRANGKTEFVHTNDATAIAIPRILIAIIENNQQKDGTIKIPEVLKKYINIY